MPLKPHQKPTQATVTTWEEEGRDLYRRGYELPTGRGCWELCRRRGWLLEAAAHQPGGWEETIPPAPETCD